MPTKYGSSEPNRPKQSDLHATVECIIGGTPVQTNKYLQSFTTKSKLVGSHEAEFVFFDYEWDVLEEFLLRKGQNTPVEFRYGFRTRMSPWINLKLVDYIPSFSNQGVTITVPLKDVAFTANKKTRDKGYPVDAFPRISTIVQWVCEQNGWAYLIEPTKPHKNPITQSGQPDTQFLTHKLKEAAVNEKGVGGYVCYFEAGGRQDANPEGTLHFHTPTYPLATKQGIYKEYNFAKELDGEVLEFTPKDNTSVLCMAGGKNANYETFDPRTKKRNVIERKMTDFKGRPMIGEGYVTEPTDIPDAPNRWITRPFENPEDLKRYAEARWSAFNIGTFGATLKLLGDPFITPLMYVRVNVIMRNGKKHDRWSGRYLVQEVEHEISPGSFTTTCTLLRESAGKIENAAKSDQPTRAGGGGSVKLQGGKYAFARDTNPDSVSKVEKPVTQG
jgi:hypothetical protein